MRRDRYSAEASSCARCSASRRIPLIALPQSPDNFPCVVAASVRTIAFLRVFAAFRANSLDFLALLANAPRSIKLLALASRRWMRRGIVAFPHSTG